MMPGKNNGYASMVRKRVDDEFEAKPATGKRRTLDDYETPPEDTERLTRFITFYGPILEPAAGSGRMARVLRAETGLKVFESDIKKGQNFLERSKPFAGNIITNPPYRDGLADAFVYHALDLAEGRVAMLMELKFLAGSRRAKRLYGPMRPEAVIIIPDRIYFIAGGKPIPSQFFSHVWIVWPPKAKRESNRETKTFWAENEFG